VQLIKGKKMRFITSVCVALSLWLAPSFAQAPAASAAPPLSAEHIKLGREVVEASGAAKSFDNVIPNFIEQAKSVILQNNPDLSKDLTSLGEVMRPDFQARISDLLNSIGTAYARTFSMDELKKIRDFYNSPEGKKMVNTLPQVLEGSYMQSQEWSAVVSRDIMARFRAEFAKKNIKI
jgi:uncharacterized protein